MAGLNEWRSQARCFDIGIDFFDKTQELRAIRCCVGDPRNGEPGCPVIQECAEYARQTRAPAGVWGGISYGFPDPDKVWRTR